MRKFKFDIDDWTGGKTLSNDMGDIVGSTVKIFNYQILTTAANHVKFNLLACDGVTVDWGDGKSDYYKPQENVTFYELYTPVEHTYSDNNNLQRTITLYYNKTDKIPVLHFYSDKFIKGIRPTHVIGNMFNNCVLSKFMFYENYHDSVPLDITISEGVVTMQDDFLMNVYVINNITLPNSLTEIGKNAFTDCLITNSIKLPDVAEIKEFAFYHLRNLGDAPIDIVLPKCKVIDVNSCARMKGFIIHLQNGVERIADRAFLNTYFSGDFLLPDTLKYIDEDAFARTHFENANIVLPESVEEIDNSAFYASNIGPTFKVPENVRRMGVYVFGKCENLKELYIPTHLTHSRVELLGKENTHTKIIRY